MKIIELTGTADTSGDLTITSTINVNGHIEKIVYDWSDGDAIADLVITEEGPVSQPVLTLANMGVADLTWMPRSLSNKVADGSAFTDVAEKIFITEKIKAVVSGSTVAISAIDGDTTTITVDTSAAHNLSAGDSVTIAGTVGYDGTYVVATKTDADTFTIADTTHNIEAEATGTIIRAGATYRFLVYVSD